jgi:iron complex outermembrane receptor protein
MRELYLYPPSNEDLRAERIWNYELAWSQRLLQGRLRYGVNLFYLNGDNLIQTINRRNVNTGKIENWGAEAEASYRLSRAWTLSTNHSLLHMEHKVVSAPSYKGYLGGTLNRGRWGAQGGLTSSRASSPAPRPALPRKMPSCSISAAATKPRKPSRSGHAARTPRPEI